MIEALRILWAAGLTIAACLAAGRMLLRRFAPGLARSEEVLLAFVPGAACLGPLYFLLALCGATHPAVFIVVQVAVIALAFLVGRASVRAGLQRHRQPDAGTKGNRNSADLAAAGESVVAPSGERRQVCDDPVSGTEVPRGLKPAPHQPAWRAAFLVIFAAFALLYGSHSVGNGAVLAGGERLASLVRLWRGGGPGRLTADLESGLPQGVDVVFLPALALGGRTAVGLVRVTFLLLLPWLMLSWARRADIGVAGVFGAVFAFASPAIGFAGSSGFDGIAMTTILFTLFHLLEIQAGAAALGITAGFACAAGYNGFLALPYLCGVLAWRRRGLRAIAAALGLAVFIASPWLVKNSLVFGNPVSPFLTSRFPNPRVTIQGERDYIRRTSTYPEVRSAMEVPLQATILGGSLGAVAGPLFLLAPFALLALWSPVGRRLLVAAVVLGASYPLNPGTRFLAPVLPFLALAMGLAFANSRILAPALVLLHAVLSLPVVTARYDDPGTPRITGSVFRPLIRLAGPPANAVTAMPDRASKARTFALGPIPRDTTPRDVIVAGDGATSDVLADILKAPILPAYKPVLERTFRFEPRRISALRLVTAGSARMGWRVAELRVYRGDVEVARSTAWRLRANPNPWDAGLAFDNTAVTSWDSRQDVEPGVRIEVEFGGPTELDRVVLECSRDQSEVPLEAYGLADSGWARLGQSPADVEAPPPPALRRAAMREFQTRGIGYIVMAESDFAARDFAERPALWGVAETAQAGGYRLYRVIPGK